MALKTINENPKTTDTILLEFETPDGNGCFSANPYKVDNVTVYYLERDFTGSNWGEYDQPFDNGDLLLKYQAAVKELCSSPDDPLLTIKVAAALQNLQAARITSTIHYKDRRVVETIGVPLYPAWLSDDTENALISNVPLDGDGIAQYGHFSYEWNPNGKIREGDFIVCWTWTPNPAGDSLSAHLPFKIEGDGRSVVTIPSHLTPDEKYVTLLDRYLPSMFHDYIADTDITPETLESFNQAIASGFTFLENLANQIIDLFDANALHESLLVYLGNLFNLKLKSTDPTLWRRQIKESIGLFKQKGTWNALQKAFAQAGMEVSNFVQFWQIVSPYTWQESFRVTNSAIFELQKGTIVEPNDANFAVWIRRSGETEYTPVPRQCVDFQIGEDFVLRMTWIGDQLSVGIELMEDDIVRVLYQYKEIPSPTEQEKEDYIRDQLMLMDARDEVEQEYPPKNWNVKLIAENDPMFNVLIPVRHPFAEQLIFGQVRTEFAYSENIYNMDEYNGSIRPSYDVCHIDKGFIDPCGACLSSCYSIDVEMEELSNDRLMEVQDILRENMPFHARLVGVNFTGMVNEFVAPPVERIDILITLSHHDLCISGEANPFFQRIMKGGLSNWAIHRDELANQQTVLSGKFGRAWNEEIRLVVTEKSLDDIGVIPSGNIMEVKSPSPNAGIYTLEVCGKNMARVTGVTEPLNLSPFTFDLANILCFDPSANITQDNLYSLSDEGNDFVALGVKTEEDPAAWKIAIPAYSATPYPIKSIHDGTLILHNDGTLPDVDGSSLSYTLLNEGDLEVPDGSGTTGELTVEKRGYAHVNFGMIELTQSGDYLYHDDIVTPEHPIVAYDEGNNFWISGWDHGTMAGVPVELRRKLLKNEIGEFGYYGLGLTTLYDHEAEFQIVDGSNPPPEVIIDGRDQNRNITDDNHFMSNYMFFINEQFFKITYWNGTTIKLAGLDQYWGTQATAGTAVAYSVVYFPKEPINVAWTVFDHLDRDGDDPVIREVYDRVEGNTAIVALSNGSTGINENITQEEHISFIIERRDGTVEQGEL